MNDTTTIRAPGLDERAVAPAEVDAPAVPPAEPVPAEPADPADASPTERVIVPAPPPDPVESHVGLRRADQWFLVATAGLACVLMLCHWARLSGWGMRPVEIERLPQRQYDYRIDINAATWVEWVQLPGIGETLARRIIDDRRQHGPFRGIDDLQRVKGIGPKTVEAIRPWLTAAEEDAGTG